jgi:hypothetical protein
VVERHLAKVNVASSNLVFRSKKKQLMIKLDFLINLSSFLYALIAQLDRVADFESVGRRFDPC